MFEPPRFQFAIGIASRHWNPEDLQVEQQAIMMNLGCIEAAASVVMNESKLTKA